MKASVEESMRVGATIADKRGKLKQCNWEPSPVENPQAAWLVSCQSPVAHLKNPTFQQVQRQSPHNQVGGLETVVVADPGWENRG